MNLLDSARKKVSILASVVVSDLRTTTARNLQMCEEAFGLDVLTSSNVQITDAISEEQVVTDELDEWSISFLGKLLAERQSRYYCEL